MNKLNKNKAKRITLHEAFELLPKQYTEIFETVVSILEHNHYRDFKTIENFVCPALEYIDKNLKDVLKHIKVNVSNKGIDDQGYQHYTIDIYVMLIESEKFVTFRKTTKSKLLENKKISYD